MGRRSEIAREYVRRLKEICAACATQSEAMKKIKEAGISIPDDVLHEFLPFRNLKHV